MVKCTLSGPTPPIQEQRHLHPCEADCLIQQLAEHRPVHLLGEVQEVLFQLATGGGVGVVVVVLSGRKRR